MLDPQDPLRFVGTVINEQYRVAAFIGAGSMSEVYEVEDLVRDRVGAMKLLLGHHGDLAARLVREGKTIGMLAHPNIVGLLDAGVLADGRPFVVTERIRGVSLRCIMEAGQVEPLRALAIIRQVLAALDHAHRHGVVHRDIKPENIMLVDDGRGEDVVKVLDFGVAKLFDDTRALLDEATLTHTGYDVFGSPLYIAPESVLGRPIEPRTDLYSVGAVLFEMLAGCPPFDGPDAMAVLRMHASVKAPTLAERAPGRRFTPELEYLVAEALAKLPQRRFASATDMVAVLDAARASLQGPRGDTMIVNAAAMAMRPLSALAAPTVFDLGVEQRAREASSLSTRARTWAGQLSPRGRLAMFGAVAATVIVLAAVKSVGASRRPTPTFELAESGAPAPASEDIAALVERGHAELAQGRELDALIAYEQAIVRTPALGSDPQIRTNISTIASGTDTVAAVVALDLLAARVRPAAREEIVAQASRGKTAEVRRRARAIAERDGFADSVDQMESYLLDLKEAKNCTDRRAAIERLRTMSDRRVIGAIRRARDRFPCIKSEANAALAQLEASS